MATRGHWLFANLAGNNTRKLFFTSSFRYRYWNCLHDVLRLLILAHLIVFDRLSLSSIFQSSSQLIRLWGLFSF